MELQKKIFENNKTIEQNYNLIDEWLISRDRSAFYSTHDFHPYFAAFPPEIIKKILEIYGGKNKVLFDPFMGGGSTIVEGVRNNYDCIGMDISEFSKFITKVKSTHFKINNFITFNFLERIKENILKYKSGRYKINKNTLPNITNLNYWFSIKSISELYIINEEIKKINDKNHIDFFKLCLSSILRKVSNAKNAQQHLCIQKNKKIPDTLEIFSEKLGIMIKQMQEFNSFSKINKIKSKINLITYDVREMHKKIKKNSVDIVITSPPYGVGSRYSDIYRLHFEFFGFKKPIKKSSLEKNKDFSEQLKIGLQNIYNSLKKNKYFFCVYGDPSTGENLTSQAIIDCKDIGFSYEGLISCPILKDKSKHHTKYKRYIPKDFILIFKK